MQTREWALIAFTIMAQMSVGSFLVLGVVHFWAARKAGVAEADKLSDRALLAIGPVLVLGMIASLFHLGTPTNAPRAIANFGTSWLSREVAFGAAFVVIGAVFAFMQWRKISTPTVRNLIALLAALVGLLQVLSMAMVYMLPTVPAWNTVATPLTFFTTTFLLGALALGAAFVVNYALLRGQQGDDATLVKLLRDTLRWIALASVALLGVEFVIAPLYLAFLSGTPAGAASAALLTDQNGVLLVLRFGLVFLGAGIFSLFIYQTAGSGARIQAMGNLTYVAFALVLIAEVIGRYLFYASYIRLGL